MGAGRLLGQEVSAIYGQKLTLGWGQGLGYILAWAPSQWGSTGPGTSWRDPSPTPRVVANGGARTVLKEYCTDLKQRDL